MQIDQLYMPTLIRFYSRLSSFHFQDALLEVEHLDTVAVRSNSIGN